MGRLQRGEQPGELKEDRSAVVALLSPLEGRGEEGPDA